MKCVNALWKDMENIKSSTYWIVTPSTNPFEHQVDSDFLVVDQQ